MKSKTMLPTSIIMTVLMIGLISSPLVTKIYANDYNDYNNYGGEMPYNDYNNYGGEMPYNDYNNYGGEMPYNDYKDYNKVKIFPPSGALTAEWWQWIMEIPSEINPLLDETGINCNENQQGPVWFLVGTPGDTTVGNLTTGSAERECTIPEGKKILFPIFNTFCSELNDEAAIREAVGIPEGELTEEQLEEGLRKCAADIVNLATIFEASIDGKEITNLEDFRVQSPVFTISFPEDNPFNVTDFIDIPQRAVSDGYWVLVKGLEPGEHTIEFRGGIPGLFVTDVTYHITIEPVNNSYNNYYDDNYGNYNNNGYENNYYY